MAVLSPFSTIFARCSSSGILLLYLLHHTTRLSLPWGPPTSYAGLHKKQSENKPYNADLYYNHYFKARRKEGFSASCPFLPQSAGAGLKSALYCPPYLLFHPFLQNLRP